MRGGPEGKLSAEELMLSNCDTRENSWDSLYSKEIKPVYPKGNYPWIFIGRIFIGAEAPTLWPLDVKNRLTGKDPNAGKDWGQKEKGWQRMRWLKVSLIQWTWVWANSRRKTGKPDLLQFMRPQRVKHDLATEKQHQMEHWSQDKRKLIFNTCNLDL